MLLALLICGLRSLVTSCSQEDNPVFPDEPVTPGNSEYLNKMQSLDWGTGTCYVYGHKTPDVDAVASSLAYAKLMRALGYNCEARVSSGVNRETELIASLFEFDLPELKTSVEPQTRLILTDHGEYLQCVDGAREAVILQKIDHHDEGDIKDADIPFVLREMVGSCCTLVYQCYKEAGVVIDDETAHILLAGIISDTGNLGKESTIQADRTALLELSTQVGIDSDSLSAINNMMRETKYDFGDMTDTEIFCSDMKEYDINGYYIAMGSLEYRQPGMDEFLDRMLAVMPGLQEENNYDMVFAKVDEQIPNTGENQDVKPYLNGGTYFIYYGTGAKAVAEAVFGPSLREGVCFSEKKLSRKQIIPLITEALAGMQQAI